MLSLCVCEVIVCERWYVTRLCVCVKLLYVKFVCVCEVIVCERGGGGRRGSNPGYRIKNKNPTQLCLPRKTTVP